MAVIRGDNIKEGELFMKWLDNRFKANKNVLGAELGATGCQPKGSKVLMANGEWKNIEQIKKGDYILSPQKNGGNIYSKVISTTNWLCKDNYYITEKNRTKKKLYSCSYNHTIPYLKRWVPREKGTGLRLSKNVKWDYKEDTAEIFSSYSKRSLSHIRIGFTSKLIKEFKGRINCKIEPYTLGVFLGDGCSVDKISVEKNKEYYNQKRSDKKKEHTRRLRVLNITSQDIEILEEVSKFYPIMSVGLKKLTKAKSYAFSINGNLSKQIEKYNLNGKNSGNKFIPKEALLSDYNYRKRLLAGLIDTDGYYAKGRGGYQFTLKSKQLIEDIKYLVYSLGGRCNEIRKVKKGIKSIGFVGEYYSISFYLGDLLLPLKLNYKKRDVPTIYLDSNRIAIECIPNKHKEIVYGFEIDSKSKWYITDHWMVTHNSGKSYRDLRKAELWYQYKFHKPFPVENICFGLKSIVEILRSGRLKRGDVIIFEEAGANLGALDFQNKIQKIFTYILQSFRSMNIAIFFNLPYLSMLNKSARLLLHYSSESAGIDKEKKINRCIPKFHQVNQTSGKIYKKMMRAKINGSIQRVRYFSYKMPSQYLVDAYEQKKEEFLDNLLNNSLVVMAEKENPIVDTPRKLQLTDKQKEVYELLLSGLTQQQTADKLGVTQSAVKNHVDLIRKKGHTIP